MIESPVLKELVAETNRAAILKVLTGRFGKEARALRPALDAIESTRKLDRLLTQCGKCPDLEAFQKLLQT